VSHKRTIGGQTSFAAFREAILPRERPDIIEWCEANRTLSGSHAGPWRRDWCKWAIEIMRAAADRETRVVVVRGGSQIAKTESLILNVFAYRTVIDPAPAMIVCPSQTAAQDFSHQRIEPLIKTCEPLKAVVTARGTGPRELEDPRLALAAGGCSALIKQQPMRDNIASFFR
jgi:phage terminase large subunit GpA-like protein